MLLAATVANAQTISGVVRDDTGAAIPGVTVTATRDSDPGTPLVEVSGNEGEFKISGLRPGAYAIEATLDGFKTVRKNVTLVTGQKIDVVFKLVPAIGETIDVVAKAATVGEVAILESRRQAPVVSDSISAEEIKKTPDSNAASVVERLTGVTLLGNKYVFVRGLGERYSGTTMNGATLPTTETEKRVVPLDLFPAKLLATVNVVKTYTPDKPGDFGSGVVEMTTTEFPSAATVKVTVGAGRQSSASNNFRRYAGGLDMFGGGGQKLPSAIPTTFIKRRSSLDPTGFTPQEIETFGESLIGDWTGSAKSADPASDLSLTYGNTFGRMGVVLSAVVNHKYDTTDEDLLFYGLDAGDVLVPRNDYDITTDREGANAGFICNFSLKLTDNNRIYLNSMLTRDASAEDRFQEGLNTNNGGNIRDYRVRYQLEQILSNRLRGEHNFSGPGIGSLVEWSVARSNASNDSDLRENIYRESEPGHFQLQSGFAESGKLEFFNLDDNITQGGLGYTFFYSIGDGGRSGSLKAGVDHLKRTRDFTTRRFRFVTSNPLQFDLEKTPDEIFTAENIGPSGFEVREITGVNDAYDASHSINAGYVMADSTFGKWRFIGGARYEDSDQEVITFNPFDLANETTSINESRDVLPSLNVVYQLSSKTNIRAAYGRSVNRPEFRELSPFAFVEVTGGRSVAGNPDLKQATLDSFDLRWEQFPGSGEVLAASVFYKKISKPIERIIQPTTELRTSFVNADEATLWGTELELRSSLERISPRFRYLSANLNYAYIHSDVTVGAQQLSIVTSLNRPMEGQSDQVTNAALQFFRPDWGTMVRILGSYTGKRLTDVGSDGLPDIYETPYTAFDVVVSQDLDNLAKGLEVKLAATNLLDEKREFTQGGALQRSYRPGRTVSFSLSYSPF